MRARPPESQLPHFHPSGLPCSTQLPWSFLEDCALVLLLTPTAKAGESPEGIQKRGTLGPVVPAEGSGSYPSPSRPHSPLGAETADGDPRPARAAHAGQVSALPGPRAWVALEGPHLPGDAHPGEQYPPRVSSLGTCARLCVLWAAPEPSLGPSGLLERADLWLLTWGVMEGE